jgi:hypothetical protein
MMVRKGTPKRNESLVECNECNGFIQIFVFFGILHSRDSDQVWVGCFDCRKKGINKCLNPGDSTLSKSG